MGASKNVSSRPYFAWVNYAKGLGIILVVVGHAILALNGTKEFKGSEWIQPMQYFADWIYVFHMPLFFVLSGLFIQQSVSKGSRQFITRKLQTIVYPYFLWSVIQTLLQLIVPAGSRNQVTVSDLINILYKPVLQFWFLYCLFFLMILYHFFYLVFRKYTPICYLLFSIICIGLIIAGTNIGGWGILYQARHYIIYFALGAVTTFYMSFLPVRSFWSQVFSQTRYLLMITCLGFLLIVLGIKDHLIGVGLVMAQNIPFALFGVLSSISLSLILVKIEYVHKSNYLLSLINELGRFSLEIYVAHSIFMAVVRGLMVKIFKLDDYLLVFLTINFFGLCLPVLMAKLCQFYKIKYVFKFGD